MNTLGPLRCCYANDLSWMKARVKFFDEKSSECKLRVDECRHRHLMQKTASTLEDLRSAMKEHIAHNEKASLEFSKYREINKQDLECILEKLKV